MDFQTPLEALRVLGLNENATRDDIRSAYRRLVSLYHPDAAGEDMPDTTEYFITIQGAYEYLIDAYDRAYEQYYGSRADQNTAGFASAADTSEKEPRIIGSKAAMQRASINRHFAEERLRQERRAKRERIKRKKEFKCRQKAMQEDEVFDEAMAKIHAIRAAEIAMKLYEASLSDTFGMKLPND